VGAVLGNERFRSGSIRFSGSSKPQSLASNILATGNSSAKRANATLCRRGGDEDCGRAAHSRGDRATPRFAPVSAKRRLFGHSRFRQETPRMGAVLVAQSVETDTGLAAIDDAPGATDHHPVGAVRPAQHQRGDRIAPHSHSWHHRA